SAAAAFGIVILGLSGPAVSLLAIVAGLLVALVIYLLSYRGGVVGTRLILVGIGIAAMLTSLTDWVLSKAGQWDLQEALRWLTGSLNNTSWEQVLPVLAALVVFGPVLLGRSGELRTTQLGDDAAQALGVRVGRTRLIVVVAAVGLIAVATTAGGPNAFVDFLSVPMRAGMVRSGTSPLVPAAGAGAPRGAWGPARRRCCPRPASARCWCWSRTSWASSPPGPAIPWAWSPACWVRPTCCISSSASTVEGAPCDRRPHPAGPGPHPRLRRAHRDRGARPGSAAGTGDRDRGRQRLGE